VGNAAGADNEYTITLEHTMSEEASKGVCRQAEWSILIVEAPIVQKFLRAVLEREGYDAVEALPEWALEAMETSRPRVGLVITNAPGLFLQFAHWLPVIYLAACPDLDLAAQFRTCRVLQKPFHPGELAEAVRSLDTTLQAAGGAGGPRGG